MIFGFPVLFEVEQGTLILLASVSKRLWQSIINKKNIFLGEITINIHSQKHNSGRRCEKYILTEQFRMWSEMASHQTTSHYIITIALQKLCPTSFFSEGVWSFLSQGVEQTLDLSRNLLHSMQHLLWEAATTSAKGLGEIEVVSFESLSRRKCSSWELKSHQMDFSLK